MHKRTKETSIPANVKAVVYKRDRGRCLMCHRTVKEENACCHIIPRSQGGKGVEKNIITLCPDCHREYDESPRRKFISLEFAKYIEECYGEPTRREEVVYDKWKAIFNGN